MVSISDWIITTYWNEFSSEHWVVAVGGGFSRTCNIMGKQAVNINLQIYWDASDAGFGEEWNLEFSFQLLIPK